MVSFLNGQTPKRIAAFFKCSNSKFDCVTLEKGMVLTLEPGMFYDKKKYMVHEENIFISDDGPVLLTIRAQKEIPKIN